MELRAEDLGNAILVIFLPNKGNYSSTEVKNTLPVQGTIEVVRKAVCHDGSSSKRILQVEYINIVSRR